MKQCTKCGETKPLDDFHNNKNRKDGKRDECKDCHNKCSKEWYHNKGGRQRRGALSMYENKSCPQYLGIVAAERLIKHLFNDVVMMPFGFPGYDMICNRGKRINVKASTIRVKQNKNFTTNNWGFNINHNKECDFFLCMAFDNVIDCNPLIAWMMPGNEVNENGSITISSTTIHKWDKWKMNMSNAQACCNIMKNKENNPDDYEDE